MADEISPHDGEEHREVDTPRHPIRNTVRRASRYVVPKETYDPEVPVINTLLKHISKDPEQTYGKFDSESEHREWLRANRLIGNRRAKKLRARIISEVDALGEEDFHKLATEQLPQLLKAIVEYKLPLERYRATLMIAKASAIRLKDAKEEFAKLMAREKLEDERRELLREEFVIDPEDIMAAKYKNLTNDAAFDFARFEVTREFLKALHVAEELGAPEDFSPWAVEDIVSSSNQYLLFGPDTAKLYEAYLNRLESRAQNITDVPVPDIPLEMDPDQLFYEAQRMAYNDADARNFTIPQQVFMPMRQQPWEIREINDHDQTAKVIGRKADGQGDLVTEWVPLHMLVSAEVVNNNIEELQQ